MAQPYLIAMNHSEWHAKNVLKKFHRNRPLGNIELQHRYKPAQPVLSCRTVEIDTSGTRTYRSRNAADIIEEQHKLIHEIYSKARNISSAPPGGNRTKPKVVTDREFGNTGALQSLRVNGTSAGASQSRPTSGKTEFIVLKTRPSTTGSHRRRANPAIDNSEFRFEPDSDWEQVTDAYQSTRQQIHHIWEPEQRTLDEGKFVRGKKDQPSVASSIDPRSGSSWLSFGGGQQDRAAAGVVDAFTAMKHEGQFYAIDGGTGTKVAQQLHRGDKIRIGVNGNNPPPDERLKEYQENLRDERASSVNSMASPIVPLCWTDQVQREDTVLLEASTPKPPPQRPNVSETHPVVFKKFGVQGNRPPPGPTELHKSNAPVLAGGSTRRSTNSGVRVVEGYGISRRTSARQHIDGSRDRPSSRVTHIAVNRKQNGTEDDDADSRDLSYEDILDMRIKSRGTSGPLIHEQLSTAGQQLEGAAEHAFSNGDSHVNNVDSTPRSRKHRVRPMSTISSSGSQDFGGYIIGAPPANQDNGRHVTSPIDSLSGRSAGRKKTGTNAARPPPLKPNLHKTAAATGQSIGSGRNPNQNTEYINLSKQICISKEHMPAGTPDNDSEKERQMTPRSRNTAVIKSVSEHNKPKDKDVKFKANVEEIIPQNFTSKMPLHEIVTPHAETPPKPVLQNGSTNKGSDSVREDNQDMNRDKQEEDRSSVDSLGSGVEKKYAFNIPTADHEVESELASGDREYTDSQRHVESNVERIPEENGD